MSLANCDSIDSLVTQVLSTIGKKEDDIFLPKYTPNRLLPIYWSEFIRYSILENNIEKLYKFCGYSSSGNYAEGVKKKHHHMVSLKGNQSWRYYFLRLVSKKYCATCNTIKNSESFSRKESRIDGLRSSCKQCDSNYWSNNRDHYLEYYNANKQSILEKQYKYRLINKAKKAEYDKEYKLKNRYKCTANNAKRRATKLQATPNWANLVAIKEIYATCPEGCHVDHIVPLQHPLVCGLHCEFNLQHLSAHDNLSKGNRFEI